MQDYSPQRYAELLEPPNYVWHLLLPLGGCPELYMQYVLEDVQRINFLKHSCSWPYSGDTLSLSKTLGSSEPQFGSEVRGEPSKDSKAVLVQLLWAGLCKHCFH